MEAYTAFAISAVECDFQHVFVFADNLSTGCSNIALGENWLFIPFAERLQNFKLFDEALCQEVNRQNYVNHNLRDKIRISQATAGVKFLTEFFQILFFQR